jgi:hypothetical protein
MPDSLMFPGNEATSGVSPFDHRQAYPTVLARRRERAHRRERRRSFNLASERPAIGVEGMGPHGLPVRARTRMNSGRATVHYGASGIGPKAPLQVPARCRRWWKRRTKTHKDTDNFLVTVGAYKHPN